MSAAISPTAAALLLYGEGFLPKDIATAPALIAALRQVSINQGVRLGRLEAASLDSDAVRAALLRLVLPAALAMPAPRAFPTLH